MNHSLPVLKIASPCHMRWDDLTPVQGTDKRRSCEECGLDVHDLTKMTTSEVEGLLASATGRVCANAFLRADGTVILKDCPVGLRAAKARMVRAAARVAAVVVFGVTGTWLWAAGRKDAWTQDRLRALEPFATISAKLDPQALPAGAVLAAPGDMCFIPPAAPNPAPTNRPSPATPPRR